MEAGVVQQQQQQHVAVEVKALKEEKIGDVAKMLLTL